MNRLEYYDRQQESWEKEEVISLTTEYEEKELSIRNIADIHRRTPGSISYKLKSMGLITHTALSRGYMEYVQSELYQEIVETGMRTTAERKERKEATLHLKAVADAEKKEDVADAEKKGHTEADLTLKEAVLKQKEAILKLKENTSAERRERREAAAKMKVAAHTERAFAYAELKREIIDLKKDVKEMLRLIHELYEFESQ